jgi:hypothetical protein
LEKYQKAQIIIKALGLILIPGVILVVILSLRGAVAERQIKPKYVELAINILSEAPSKEKVGLRTWAVEVLQKYAPVPINEELQKELINSKSLPPAAGPGRAAPQLPPGFGRMPFPFPPHQPNPETPKPQK